MTNYHLIGIGGSGLSAIALVLLESGHAVSGSDRQLSPQVQALQAAGARLHLGHRAENLRGAQVVLRSSAIPDDNVEVQAALQAGIPVLKRADFLERLVAGKKVIAIAGTHGKTTTTAMVAWMLTTLAQDPSYVIGSVAMNLGRNAHAGNGDFFVIEADEYDHMFLGLRPTLAVVTNVEHDHPDFYPTPEEFQQAFRQFVGRLAPGGELIACADDPGAADLLAWAGEHGCQTYAYGLGEECYDCWAENLVPRPGAGYTFDVHYRAGGGGTAVSLQVPGEHNVRNALAALSVADRLRLDLEGAAGALEQFSGAGRRFEVRAEVAGVTVIDDYAHHPTEIRATLAAARARYPGRRLWAVWQPHTYSRTRLLLDEFRTAFQGADQVLVTDVYGAREALPADGFSSRQIVEAIANAGVQAHDTPELGQARDYLARQVRPGDVVLVFSAGDAIQVSEGLTQDLAARQAPSTRIPEES
jgi:UDP-N-acetylmuramate--alanine ligase